MDIRKHFETFLNKEIQKEFDTFIARCRKANESLKSHGYKLYRNGYRTRKLNTTLGVVVLRIPRTNKIPFMPSFIERWKRNTDELNILINRMYINGVSTGKVNNCTKAIGVNISKSQVSSINKKYSNNEVNESDLSKSHYKALYFDATYEKVRTEGKVKLCAMITVIGYLQHGYETIATIPAPDLESEESYTRIIQNLLYRGLKEPDLIISDYHSGLLNAMRNMFPNTKHQRCKVHFMRNIMVKLNKQGKRELAPLLKQIYHTSSKAVAMKRADDIISKYKDKHPQACLILHGGIESTLTYTEFANDELNHRRIETSNPIENINRQFKQRTKTITSFPNIESLHRLYCSLISNRM